MVGDCGLTIISEKYSVMINYNHSVVVFLLLSLGIFKPGSCSEYRSQTNNVTVKCIQTEREALVSFKAGVNDIPGKLSSWVGEDCCQWKGVVCDNESGHVIMLNLSNPAGRHRHFEYDEIHPYAIGCSAITRCRRKISSSLIHFEYLNYLDLSWNNFV